MADSAVGRPRVAAVGLTILTHIVLVALLLQARRLPVPALAHSIVALKWVLPLPPPAPTPPPPKEKPLFQTPPLQTVRERTPVAPPKPAAVPLQAIQPSAPEHTFSAENNWVTPSAVTPAAAGEARRAPSGYAEAIKSLVIARLVYPPDALYKPPAGFKGDPKSLKRQCTIPYEIVVDRQGKMISYQIERCGDDLLDAAAEAALLKAGPFPAPPNATADQYVVYGSANFRK